MKVPPRRLGAAVPFELARLVLPVSQGRAELLVFAPQHMYAEPTRLADLDGDITLSSFSVDETANYFGERHRCGVRVGARAEE